ncbi:MAG: hypothetical protein ACWA5X_14000 [bacterium]
MSRESDVFEYVLLSMHEHLGETGLRRLRDTPEITAYKPLLRSLFNAVLASLCEERQAAHMYYLVRLQRQDPSLSAFDAENLWFEKTLQALAPSPVVNFAQWKKDHKAKPASGIKRA